MLFRSKLGRHWLGSLQLNRECAASLNAQELTREKKIDIGENLPPTVNFNTFPQVKYTCVDSERAKTSMFKEPSKDSLGSLYQKRECAASLNARK